jgi:hypothetical protein
VRPPDSWSIPCQHRNTGARQTVNNRATFKPEEICRTFVVYSRTLFKENAAPQRSSGLFW